MGDLSWRFDEREYNYIKEVLDSGFASGTSGNMNGRLEAAFCEAMDLEYAVTFNSGTTTLHSALWALGVGYGDEVLVTPLTVIACMYAILHCNAIPVFVDVDPDTFLMDPEDMARKITPRTKAVMPVHLYGQVCDMTRIMELAKEHNLGVVEDCAQCYLGTHNGQVGGTIGDVGSWSFENSKHLTTGDGGIIATNNEELATHIRKLSSIGFRNASAKSGKIRVDKDIFQNPDYKRHDLYGFMQRMPEVAAAMGLAQVEKLKWFVDKRVQMATMYREAIEKAGGLEWLIPQVVPEGDFNSYYSYGCRYIKEDVSWRDFRAAYMKNGGDGIYACWALCYQEDCVPDVTRILDGMGLEGRLNTETGICPNAEMVQKQIMQFTTNQKDEAEMESQAEALYKTVRQFA